MNEDFEGGRLFGAYKPSLSVKALIQLSQSTPLGRGKLRRKITNLIRSLHKGPLDASIFGSNIRVHLHGNGSETKALLKPSLYSRTANALLSKYLPKQNAVIVDIGANVGVFSLLAISRIDRGRLIAIEPQPKLFNRLNDHLGRLNPSLNELIDVTLCQCAVGAFPTTQALYVPSQVGQASLHCIPNAEKLNVNVRTLHEIIKEVSVHHIDILKVDVEGYEDDVLLPFLMEAQPSILPRAILLEHCHRNRWKQDVEQILIAKGYSVKVRGRTDLALARAAE